MSNNTKKRLYTSLRNRMRLPPLEKKIQRMPMADIYTEDEILRIYARSWYRKRIQKLGDVLASDFTYSSFWVYQSLNRSEYLRYLDGKLRTIRNTGSSVRSQIIKGRNLILLLQGDSKAVLDIKIKEGLIREVAMMPTTFYKL